jgi:hypothetical protein
LCKGSTGVFVVLKFLSRFAEQPIPVLRVEVTGGLTAIPEPDPRTIEPREDDDILVAAQNRCRANHDKMTVQVRTS